MSEFDELQQAVINGDYKASETLTRQALENGTPAMDISRQALIPAMAVVGQKMKSNEYFIPEVLMSVKAMNAASGLIKPLLAASKSGTPFGKVILGTIKGDLHDVGKNLVAIMLEGGGFEVIDLGIDVPPEKFVQAVEETGANLIGMSALLTSTMVHMKDVIDALTESGKRESVKIMIGGAPVSERFSAEIGADGTANDAGDAVELAKRLASIS